MSDILMRIGDEFGEISIIATIATLSLLVTAFAYKENLFGFKNWVRKTFRAEPEAELDNSTGTDAEDKKDYSEIKRTASKEPVKSTPLVRFETERLPNAVDLQKAIHAITSGEERYRVPFEYDPKISFLTEKTEELYDQYEHRLEKRDLEPSPFELSDLRNAIDIASVGLRELPETVGLAVRRLHECEGLGDVYITETCSRFIELRLTQILSGITAYQFADESPILVDYANAKGMVSRFVAMVDGVAHGDLVSYRIQFIGDASEQIVFAPWNQRLRDSEEDDDGIYVPPISFLARYCYPQRLLWHINEPEKWNFEWKCTSLFVKDLDGNYI